MTLWFSLLQTVGIVLLILDIYEAIDTMNVLAYLNLLSAIGALTMSALIFKDKSTKVEIK